SHGGGQTEASAVAENDFDQNIIGRGLRREGDGHKGHGSRGGDCTLAVALGEGSAPGIKIGGGQIVPGTVGEDGQIATQPACQVPTPELLLTGISGLALSHGKNLQDTGNENRVPK